MDLVDPSTCKGKCRIADLKCLEQQRKNVILLESNEKCVLDHQLEKKKLNNFLEEMKVDFNALEQRRLDQQGFLLISALILSKLIFL